MLTHIRIDKDMENSIEEVMEYDLYNSKSEFIRAAIREKIKLARQERAIEGLRKLKGTGKGNYITREERAKAVREGIKSDRDVFKEYGLK